jgi:hypothetical protein
MQARPVANPQASCSRRNGMALRPSTAWRRQQHHLGTPPPPHSLLPHQQHAPRRGSALVSAAMQSAAGTTSSLISQRSSRLGAPLPSQSRRSTRSSSSSPRTTTGRASRLLVRAERKEYYDFKDMPPLPLGVKRIYIPGGSGSRLLCPCSGLDRPKDSSASSPFSSTPISHFNRQPLQPPQSWTLSSSTRRPRSSGWPPSPSSTTSAPTTSTARA